MDNVISLHYTCNDANEYKELSTGESNVITIIPEKLDPDVSDLYIDVFDLKANKPNINVCIHIVSPTKTETTRKHFLSYGQEVENGKRVFPVFLSECSCVCHNNIPAQPPAPPTQTEPKDYHFLSWVWRNLDDFCKAESSDIIDSYEKETGEKSPYLSEEEEKMLSLEETFYKELEEGKVPELISYLIYETDDLPKNDDILGEICSSVARYYGKKYTDLIFHSTESIRLDARKRDKQWETKVLQCILWDYNLHDEDDEGEETLEHGTTNEEQIKILRKEYTKLSLIQPSRKYEIIEDDGGFVYSGDVVVYTDERWDQELVDRCLSKPNSIPSNSNSNNTGFVIGVFAYNTYEEAEEAQNKRIDCLYYMKV